MATAWPGSLPQQFLLDVRDQDRESRVRTPMDQGPPKLRRRFSAAVRELKVHVFMDGAQRVTFDTLYRTTLKQGSLPFDHYDPVDAATVTYQFVRPPMFRITNPGVGSSTDKRWRVDMSLEILP